MERDIVIGREPVEIAMIRYDGRDFDGQRADAVPVEQVVEAMTEFRYKNQNTCPLCKRIHLCGHGEALNRRREETLSGLAGQTGRSRERYAHKEPAAFHVAKLRAIGDVAAVFGEKACDGGDDPWPVGAGQRKDEGRVLEGHRLTL